jgi:hypothetical protein
LGQQGAPRALVASTTQELTLSYHRHIEPMFMRGARVELLETDCAVAGHALAALVFGGYAKHMIEPRPRVTQAALDRDGADRRGRARERPQCAGAESAECMRGGVAPVASGITAIHEHLECWMHTSSLLCQTKERLRSEHLSSILQPY